MNEKQTKDTFADIAAGGMDLEGKGLQEPSLPHCPEVVMELAGIDPAAVFEPVHKVDRQEELLEELAEARERYAPFMAAHSPPLESGRIRQELQAFDWRIGTKEDERNFQGVLAGHGQWERVELPHYGEPLGPAFTLYRTDFTVTRAMLDLGQIFIVCKGVDYKARIFVNGACVGAHEGFFSPFEMNCTDNVVEGSNTLVIRVENDNTGLDEKGGDKIYAATGVGYDDPVRGWHHCPAGMGIYQGVAVEARTSLHIGSVYVRPLADLEQAEVWIEVNSLLAEPQEITLKLSVYGKNFPQTVWEGLEWRPQTGVAVGLGDSFTQAKLHAEGKLHNLLPLLAERGRNRYIVPIHIPFARRWEPEAPWLYQLHVEVMAQGRTLDARGSHFGMRTFRIDTAGSPKGAMYLNDRPIRLRGANTMGHEQQCVAKRDWDQLRDDILLAKLCNMNFLRITQRPVETEVYDYCDMLGLMVQTDLPLFGVLSRSQFCEAVRQAEEMERLIRPHPCCILSTYINEPFPNAQNRPHRHLTRKELEGFFQAADLAVRLNNPDRVTKHVDGDYDPPSGTLPDNHCYPLWYNGHGIDFGRLNKGHWLPVKPDWYYGCGEFGAEGLDPVAVMRRYYPPEWLPSSSSEERSWSPNSIIGAQTGRFHYFFYETPESLEEWVDQSHRHQAWAARMMTEAFRRDWRMTSFAIHLFIDAFPSGWMKTIMDVERRPKPAYFAYRNALEPLLASLRTDRLAFYEGEEISLEAWICNDRWETPESARLQVMVVQEGKLLAASLRMAQVPACSSACQGIIRFTAPRTNDRSSVTVWLGLCDSQGRVLSQNSVELEVHGKREWSRRPAVAVLGAPDGKAFRLVEELGVEAAAFDPAVRPDVLVADNSAMLAQAEEPVSAMLEEDTKVIVLELEPGNYDLWGCGIQVKPSSMQPLYFVSRKTGHPLVEGFRPGDFRLWYSPKDDRLAPLLYHTMTSTGLTPVLLSGNTNDSGEWEPALAAGERKIGMGHLIVSQVELAGRCSTNPAAREFALRLFEWNGEGTGSSLAK
ncbi:glycosyl hydrolase 2 galactose-binding domain-containing protein [Paenibacillus sp. YN15]|uniref:glycosyl hydrolase 2 galactose-binding domain-containing protein n=1 Tax=Paenibacillus sp. YN15 TaxID=1742774 RepID=UPI000DCEDCBE|nr:glycoside hydrolase family 2 TIM barrel-domain containing protein [Paenibacillus sp. YN15]RAV01198.1 glycoside hydrolase family 2 [Paenibacillus sp. YN15]